MRPFALLFLLVFFNLAFAKQPQLTPKDAKLKIEEVLQAHVQHKTLSEEIVRRSFLNFLDQLDPVKTYLIDSEVHEWTSPEETLLSKVVKEMQAGDFSQFQAIHARFAGTIERRHRLEAESVEKPIPEGTKSSDLKDLTWARDEQELMERVAWIKALQLEATEKLSEEMKDKFLKRLEKRRMKHESEFAQTDPEERLRLVLACVLKSVMASLDAHTNYFTPIEADQFMMQVQQRLFGIGAQLQDNLDGLVIKGILENSPASQSNRIKVNDKIIAVDREPVVGMDLMEAVSLIRGERGTPVSLTILRESEEAGERKVEKLEVELIRNEVVLEETRLDSSFESFGDGVIANLKLFSFYQDEKSSSASDMRKVLERLKKEQNLKGVLLDLRGNMGGLLKQAVSVTGLFINRGIVASIQDHTGKVQHLREIEGKPVWEGPLIILVNKASASAAEIVAQTLQDYGRAFVVGDECTFGKGSFQTSTFDGVINSKSRPQGEYKVTRGRYYTVSGKSPQLVGVASDITIPGIYAKLDIGEKFEKFPLENHSIEPHFDDDLSDLSQLYRLQLGAVYHYNLQKKMDEYQPYLELLKENSMKRIAANKMYQKFLVEAEKKNFDAEVVDIFTQLDLQLVEALNVMKDLIFFVQQPYSPLHINASSCENAS